MIQKTKLLHRVLSMLMVVGLLFTSIPLSALITANASEITGFSIDPEYVADPGTAHTWESMMGTDIDGNRYSGRVWADKSVFADGETALLDTKGGQGSSFKVELDEDESFQVVFSVLGSTMTTKETSVSSGPMDVVLVLDTSTSMDDTDRAGVTRLERTISASNALLKDLLSLHDVRIAIVTYNKDSETVLPLAEYKNGITLKVTNYYNNDKNDAGVVTAYDKDGKKLGSDDGYTQGTNLQAGIERGFNILANATDAEGRAPVAIVLTDGQANRACKERFYELPDADGTSASGRNLYLSTLLNAAYNKTKIENHYGTEATVYTVGVDITSNVTARLLMNPADATNGFNNRNSNNDVKRAYENFQKWASGSNVSHDGWSFDHKYPAQNGAMTDAKIAANINYADAYYDVSGEGLQGAFEQIYHELTSGAFNPISSTTSVTGGTAVEHTPLIYVDFIGQYMEVKDIQAITLFGASYNVVKNADGTYTVAEATGTNPTTSEKWNTAENVHIAVIEEADGTQKMEIKIDQEILPIIMEQIVAETVGNEMKATITEVLQSPLRVFYTVGLDSDILLPNGEIDASKIRDYKYVDTVNGTATFYSNEFGVMNKPGADDTVMNGDAHIGFKPSDRNRYYYYQTQQGIFTKITDKATGKEVTISENEEYGIVWDEDAYELTWMSYADYLSTSDTAKVYTYVTYYRPTPSASDAANAAEQVTYLVYHDWSLLKESVAFYDNTAEVYLYDGKAIPVDQVESVVGAYLQSNPRAELYAVLGMSSLRTSRLHNMTVAKADNKTETAIVRYAPEYTHETASAHNENDVVVWLGNNGKLTVDLNTGIALTKEVTEPIGDVNDTYTLTVTVPAGVAATPVVENVDGKTIAADYTDNVLTVKLKAGETVYISGIPAGTECLIGEVIPEGAKYGVSSNTGKVTVPTAADVLAGEAAQYVAAKVINAPIKDGNLFITKEINSNHAIPESVLNTPFEIKVTVGKDLAGKTFTVEDSAQAAAYEKTVDADGNMVFSIKARQTIEILGLPAGTKAMVTETTPDAHFAVSYRSRDYSGATADDNNAVTIPEGANSTVVVLNAYTPSPVSVDLDIAGTKNFTAEGNHPGGKFVYKVQQRVGNEWVDIEGKTAETPYADNEHGTKTFSIEDVLSGITYTEVGSYAYQVLEVKGDVANVTYDRTLYTFTVTVTDNGGQLVAAVTDLNNSPIEDGSYEVTFENTYHTAPISMDITKVVVNNSGDQTVSAQGFKFRSIPVDANGEPLSAENPETKYNTIYTDAAGEARISGVYTKEGTYYYIVYEVNGGKSGWTYSGAEYLIKVVVTADETGNLAAVMEITPKNEAAQKETAPTVTENNKGHLYFTNTYDPEDVTVDLDGKVAKELNGKTLEADQFTFYVYHDGDRTSPVLTGTNDLNGNASIIDFNGALTFGKVGKYTYDIVEGIPAGAVYDEASGMYVLNGMYYDPTVFDFVVEVENDPATGKLVATSYFEDATSNVVTFHNRYRATPTSYAVGGTKVLSGRAVRNGEFKFQLYAGDQLLDEAVNQAGGSFLFDTIHYTEPGVYTYTIKEVAGDVPGVEYTGVNKPVTVTVTVTDANGVLHATASMSNADIKFENTYRAKPAQVTFNGTKTFIGGDLADDAFTFKLYATDRNFGISETNLLATATNEGTAFALGTYTLDKTGTYYFTVIEDASVNTRDDVVYDSTAHNYIVHVTDNGQGQLAAEVQYVNSGRTVSGTAITLSASFTNAHEDEVTEKEVYYNGETTEIDGQKVKAGDILTYYISYTNYNGKEATVTIDDVIPAYTSYVEGTASHGGVYSGTHLLWTLTVPAGESVTVHFNVRVDQSEVIFANIATIRDGYNTYTTNEVTNFTVEEEAKKDVFAADDTTVSINGDKVYGGDELYYVVSYTNTSAESVDITITDAIPAHTTYVDGSATNDGKYADGKLTWTIEDVAAWSTVEVAFKVTVDEDIGAEIIENQANVVEGNNEYTTNKVTNYTVVDEVEKTVYLESAPDVNIDGEKVCSGDVLVYNITYKNTAEESATVTITDKIPAHTTYVEGSAGDGIYADGVITWTIEDVPADETVTVSFKVTVDEDLGAATITNKALIVEGKNEYTTDEVINFTTQDEVAKDVFYASAPTVSINGKKVRSDETLLYMVSYKNTGRKGVTVTITDAIPEYTTYVEGSASNGGSYQNGVVTWTVNVAAGQTETVTFEVTVDKNIGAQVITNKAVIVEGNTTYTTNEVSNYTVVDEVGKSVYLESKPETSIDGKKVYGGDVLLYNISYKNTAKESATITITDEIPAFTTYLDGSADNGGAYQNGVITWNLEVGAGESITVTFKVVVDADIGAQTIANQATILEGSNKYTTNEVTNYTVVDKVDKIVKLESQPENSIDGEKVYAGDVLEYLISYTNTAKEPVKVTITDEIPDYTTYVNGSADNGGTYQNGVVTWTLEVGAGETVTVSFKVTVDANVGAVDITNRAVVVEGANRYTTNEVTNYTTADEVEKDVFSKEAPNVSIDGEKVYSGETLTYAVSYKNTGKKSTTVTITDVIPDYTTYVEGSATNGGTYQDGVVTWTLDVSAGGTVIVKFQVTVDENIGAKTIPNKAVVVEGKNEYTTNEVTNYTVVDEVGKTVYLESDPEISMDGKKVYSGDVLVYQISYKNTANESAAITITDKIPAYTTYVEGSADNGGTYQNGVITWNLEVGAGETVVVSFKVTVDDNIGAEGIENQAVIVDGNNRYTTNAVTNYTTDDEVEKDVFSEKDPKVSIDGSKVNVGETLVYAVTYKNTAREGVTVTITDAIPEHTVYVEGSVSNGGVYSDGVLTWNLEVGAGESVTVTFKVKVTAKGAQTIANQATVLEGKNEYTTNEVTNYTVVDEVQKNVYKQSNPYVNFNGRKVYTDDILVYEISYKNNAKESVTVSILDTIPMHTAYVAGSASHGGVYRNGTIAWNLEVAAGETVTVSFCVKVTAKGAHVIANKATILEGSNKYITNEVVNYTTVDEVEKDVYSAENLRVSIDGDKVYDGDTLVYAITYKNNAMERVTVTITDAIPAFTEYVEGSASHGGVFADGKLTWNLRVGAGQSVTVTFKVKVTAEDAQVITNQATVVEGNNTYITNEVENYTVEDEVEKTVSSAKDPNVSIDGRKVNVGDILVYEITYKNTAKESATVTITDMVPAHTTYVAGSASHNGAYADGVVTWNLEVAAGESVTVSFRVEVTAEGAQIIANTATILEGKNEYTTNETVNYTTVDEVGKDVYFAKNPNVSINGKKVNVGDILVYAITYKNTAKEGVSITITDVIPAHTAYVEGSATNGGVYADGVVTWNLEVGAGESVTVYFSVEVIAEGAQTIKNQATIVEGSNKYTTNEVTNYTVVDEVEKEVFSADAPTVNIDGKKVYVGDILVYTITYKNTAKESATVTITDMIPEYTVYVEGSASNGGVYENGVVLWILEVGAGESVTVSFSVEVTAEGAQTIANEATILEGNNKYTTNEVINYTTDDEVEKNVFVEQDPEVNIDGEQVSAGDILVYTISYKNTAKESVTVTIIDTIPEHTTYVEGSASHGGVYEDGVITWTLEVGAGESVTVSFQVEVAEEGGETIANKATVLEGKNEYTTNEVTNEIEEPKEDDSPATGDIDLLPLFFVLIVSGYGLIFATKRYRKKFY